MKGLLGMTQYLDMMKGQSIIALVNKLCRLAYEKREVDQLVQNPKFIELMDYVGSEWVFGD